MFYYHIWPPWFNQIVNYIKKSMNLYFEFFMLAYLVEILGEVPIEVYGMC